MIDLTKKSMPNDFVWFAKRYNSLIVGFPKELTSEMLKTDDVCAGFDANESVAALKSAHEFLRSVASEMLLTLNETENTGKTTVVEQTFMKIDVLWGIGFYSELQRDCDGYFLSFVKQNLKNKQRSLPKDYAAALGAVAENGLSADYFKDGRAVREYKSCDSGIFRFSDGLTALGIHLFVKKCAQKRWYWDVDKAGGYTSESSFEPVMHTIEPYNRVDMRVFTCGERLKYDIHEQLAGYSDEMISCFDIIFKFVKENYPECMPAQGFYNYVCCSCNFMTDLKHAMLGVVGLGHSENFLRFYGAMSSKVRELAIAELGDEVRADRFQISNKADAEYAVKVMKIKAKYGTNVVPKKKRRAGE